MDVTDRIKLPLLAAGQAQKELWHNEALVLADLLLGGLVEAGVANSPPESPVVGRLYSIGTSATGAWTGHSGELVAFTAGGWRFAVPFEGLRLTERTSGLEWIRTVTGWEVGNCRASAVLVGGQQVVGQRQASIAAPTAGSTIDVQARSCLNAILAVLRTHGLIET